MSGRDYHCDAVWQRMQAGSTNISSDELLVLLCLAKEADSAREGLYIWEISAQTNIRQTKVKWCCQQLVKLNLAYKNGNEDRWICREQLIFPAGPAFASRLNG